MGSAGLDDAVRVWQVALDAPAGVVARMKRTLSVRERADVDRRIRGDDARRLIVSRAALREILGSILGMSAESVALDRTCLRCGADHGRPRLIGGPADLAFSLSRAGDIAVVAVALRQTVGIDVERIRGDSLIDDVVPLLAASERAALADARNCARTRDFYVTWTRKEAYLKATGDGLSRGLDTFAVSPSNAPPAVIWDACDVPQPKLWLADVEMTGAHVAAVAVSGDPARVVISRLHVNDLSARYKGSSRAVSARRLHLAVDGRHTGAPVARVGRTSDASRQHARSSR